MKLIFLTICLIIVLITEETLIFSGFHAKTHRLLPLVIALMALYDFYLIVEDITGQADTMDLLAKLLLVQFLDVIIYFIIDFMKIKIGFVVHFIIISLLIFMDVLIFVLARHHRDYNMPVAIFALVSVIGIFGLMMVKAPKLKQISRQSWENNFIMGVALAIPAFALVMVELGIFQAGIAIPLTSDICCLIIEFLFLTDRLQDVDSFLKEENFHTLDIPACLFDNDFFFLDASNKARELFFQEITTMSLFPKHYALQEELSKLQAEGGVSYRELYGRYYRLELQEARDRGKKKGYILTFTDITNEKEETNIARELAKQKSEFLANMSHDLRSPLHAIIGSSEVALSRGDMSSKSLVMVNHIHEAGKNLLDIVNSILDFSKLESGELRLFPQKYDFLKLVEEQASQGFANLKNSEVALSVEVRNPFPEYLYGDKIRVRQIIQNLLSNAIKFTETGSISCFFDVNIEDKSKIRITYSVKDTGQGMTQEQRVQIFDDYVTFAQEQNKEGTGLGLPIVKKLSEMMGGHVEVESEKGSGTTFTAVFYQELDQEDKDKFEKDGIQLISPTIIRNENDLRDRFVWKNTVTPSYNYPEAKVLLADDMAVNREIFKSLTEPWGFCLDMAENGQEAVKMAAEKEYDLIFLDQMMPVMTGLEAADALQAQNNTAPKILLSANITESLKADSKAHGFDTFMNKPIDIAQLKTNIEGFLPEKLRKTAAVKEGYEGPADWMQSEGYIKALRTYVEEVEELQKLLPEYAEKDLNMFRNKVHGLKGVSRQLGLKSMANYSEVMEMAAISEHVSFILAFLSAYMDELEFTVETGKYTLEQYEKSKETFDDEGERDGELKELSGGDIKGLLEKMISALMDYDVNEIDKSIEELDTVRLPEKLEEAYGRAKSAYEDVEYEDALAVLTQAVNEM